MDITSIGQLAATIGVPSAICFVLIYILYKNNEQHHDEVSALKDTIAANTVVLSQLKELFETFVKDGGAKK